MITAARVVTGYDFTAEGLEKPLRLAVAPDIHSGPFDDVLEEFTRCDAVLIPGDLVDRHRDNNENAWRFLETVPDLVPVFYSVGNHELRFPRRGDWLAHVRKSKAVLLDNRSVSFRGIRLGGLSSAKGGTPDLAFLSRFEKEPGYRLLMCHNPETWRKYVAGRDISLTLCGHAHGGQMQFFGRGLYAPGQGLFPKLTHGLYGGGRMLLSRGMTNSAQLGIPRINNPCELIILTLNPEPEPKEENT